jgi:hypothetical protein
MRLPKQSKAAVRIRVPFELDRDAGLGDVLKRATAKVGIRPCRACDERAATMNRYVVFAGRGPRHG